MLKLSIKIIDFTISYSMVCNAKLINTISERQTDRQTDTSKLLIQRLTKGVINQTRCIMLSYTSTYTKIRNRHV